MKRKAGRPTAVRGSKRSEIFRFVATPGESKKIRGRAKRAGQSLSDYLRQAALGKG
jgi:Mobilization protein NikA